MVTTPAQKTKREECPTCMGKKGIEKKGIGRKIIEELCDVSSELENSKITDGQIRPDDTCPTCKGKGYIEKDS